MKQEYLCPKGRPSFWGGGGAVTDDGYIFYKDNKTKPVKGKKNRVCI